MDELKTWEYIRGTYVNGNITHATDIIDSMSKLELAKLCHSICCAAYESLNGSHSGDLVDAIELMRRVINRTE